MNKLDHTNPKLVGQKQKGRLPKVWKSKGGRKLMSFWIEHRLGRDAIAVGIADLISRGADPSKITKADAIQNTKYLLQSGGTDRIHYGWDNVKDTTEKQAYQITDQLFPEFEGA